MAEQAQAVDSGPRPIVPLLKLQPKTAPDGLEVRDLWFGLYRHYPDRLLQVRRDRRFQADRAPDKGKVYVFSVVHQSFPGIKTPYITAIVDLPRA